MISSLGTFPYFHSPAVPDPLSFEYSSVNVNFIPTPFNSQTYRSSSINSLFISVMEAAAAAVEDDEAYNSLFLTSVGVASSIDEMALLDVSGGFLGSVGANNSSFALNATRVDLMNHPVVQVHIYALYAIIFVVGLLGNVLVVFVVAQNRAMQTVTNCFIANLALSDILLCVLAVPFTPLYFYLNEWIFGKILCHLVAYSQVLTTEIHDFVLTTAF